MLWKTSYGPTLKLHWNWLINFFFKQAYFYANFFNPIGFSLDIEYKHIDVVLEYGTQLSIDDAFLWQVNFCETR